MIVISVVALVLAAVSVPLYRYVALARADAEADAEQARATIESLQRELESRSSERAQRERAFFLRFAREFPQLTEELHSQVDPRVIPAELIKILLRSFHPWQAIVVVRRSKATTEPSRDRTLVVAAVARPGTGIQAGMELQLGEGELGLVAENQQVMGRDDLAKLAPHVQAKRKMGPIGDLEFDLLAPMMVGEETLGVLAVARPNLYSESSKAVVGLVARMGAMAIHNATAYQKLKVSAELDGLTGIYNKSSVHKALSERIRECEAQGTTLSILLFDIDNFKNYNDLNGHDEGDRLLREFAKVVSDNTRTTSIFGRYGGEEFLLILPDTTGEAAMKAAENVRKEVAAHAFDHRERQPLGVLSFSGGVACYPEDAGARAGLIRAADKALYEAKRGGRNQVHRAQPRGVEGDTEDVQSVGADPVLADADEH